MPGPAHTHSPPLCRGDRAGLGTRVIPPPPVPFMLMLPSQGCSGQGADGDSRSLLFDNQPPL